MKIWLTHIACWIFKATNSHSEYTTLTAFPQQKRLHERTSSVLFIRAEEVVEINEIFEKPSGHSEQTSFNLKIAIGAMKFPTAFV